MGFESRAISARVTKQIVTIFSKTCDKLFLFWVRLLSGNLLENSCSLG